MAGPVNFALSERSLDGTSDLLSVEGDTTRAAAGRIKRHLGGLLSRSTGVVIVDLSRVSFVDSTVVQALSDAAAAAKKNGSRLLIVEPVDPMIARPLEMGRLDLVAEVLPTLGEAERAANLPPGAVQAALPPPPAPPPEPDRPRRALFGRRAMDQQILQELGQLRRLAQELRRESGLHQQVSTEEIERRRVAEEDLLRAREGATRDPGVAAELAQARAQLEQARASAGRAHAESDRMEEEAEQAHARIQELERELATARGEAAAARRELEGARSEVQGARSEADRLDDEAEQAHARIQALEAENAELRAQLEQARSAANVAAAAESATEDREQVAQEEEAAGPRRAEESAEPRPKVPVWADPAPINLNTADLEELMLLPGIGRRPAERIIEFREARGGLTKVDDLLAIDEIPNERVMRIRPYVRV